MIKQYIILLDTLLVIVLNYQCSVSQLKVQELVPLLCELLKKTWGFWLNLKGNTNSSHSACKCSKTYMSAHLRIAQDSYRVIQGLIFMSSSLILPICCQTIFWLLLLDIILYHLSQDFFCTVSYCHALNFRYSIYFCIVHFCFC